jgi:ribosomal protein L7/L12
MHATVKERRSTRIAAGVLGVLTVATSILALVQGHSILESALLLLVAYVFLVAAVTGRGLHPGSALSGEEVRAALAVQVPEAVAAAVREGHSLDAIRMYRSTTGSSLAEAKAALDCLALQKLYWSDFPPAPAAVMAALANGRKLEAIKYLRRERRQSLRAAKRAVEHYELRRIAPA